MAVGYNTLLTIMICAEYDPESDVLSDLGFPAPTEAFKRVSMLATKDECVRALKQMLDTNNMMRGPGSEHNMLIMSRENDGVDPLVLTAIITIHVWRLRRCNSQQKKLRSLWRTLRLRRKPMLDMWHRKQPTAPSTSMDLYLHATVESPHQK